MNTERLTTEEFIKRAKNIHGNKYDYSKVEYHSAHKKVCIICPEHGEFWQTPQSHLRGHGCGKCSGKFLDKAFFIEKSIQKHGDKYDYSKVENFNKNTDKVSIICPIHGIFKQRVCEHLEGCGCPQCGKQNRADKRRSSPDEIINSFIKVHGDCYDYSMIPEYYINFSTKVPIICKRHGIFWQTPSNHLQCGCPNCNNSVGEEELYKLLKKHSLNVTREKTFDWLKYKRLLRIDLFLEDYNIGIEYQGIQHFKPVNFGGCTNETALEEFNEGQKRDAVKMKLCNEHNIKLYHIKYTDDINAMVEKILFENNIKKC